MMWQNVANDVQPLIGPADCPQALCSKPVGVRLYIPSRDRDVAKQLREELESRLAATENDEDMQGTDTSVGNRP
jgi:hypothetical protein